MSIYTPYVPVVSIADQRDAARRFVQRQPDADTLLDMLGLDDIPPAVEQPDRHRGYRRDSRRFGAARRIAT